MVILQSQSQLFKNIYRATDVSISIEGTKILENRALADDEFKFLLYPADSEFSVADNAIAQEAMNKEDGSFVFDTITFSEAATYYFVVSEDANTTAERVTNDNTVYYVAIEIKDDEIGKLYEASRVIKKAGSDETVEDIVFNNIFTPGPTDITVDINVNKTVVNKGRDKIGPEGFEFVLENTDTGEKRTFRSDENGNAVLTLSYLENDIGKTYTYNLTEIDSGIDNVQYSTDIYTITAEISLNENNELVATLTNNGKNVTTVVADFENVYDHTTTTTPDEPEVPDEPDTPETPNIPQTGDNTNLQLWFALLFIGGGGLISTTVCGKKKKEETN